MGWNVMGTLPVEIICMLLAAAVVTALIVIRMAGQKTRAHATIAAG